LVGKGVREILMSRIVRFYRGAQPSLPDASGYNDPVTQRFISGTAKQRLRLEIPDDCFRREQGRNRP